MNNIKKLVGKRIKELRQQQGLSQQQLAELVNIDQRNLSHIECGDTFPSKSLLELASALNTELNEIFDFEHLKIDNDNMKGYIIKSLDILQPDNIKIIYRIVKSMK